MLDRSRKNSKTRTKTSLNAHAGIEKNPAAVFLGRLGGLKGGKARAAALSKKQRIEIARRAATARWNSNDS